jgi:hypothetical protein
MMPFIVPFQVSNAVVWKLRTDGFRIGTETILKKQERPYMNVKLFHEYIPTILLPHIARIRSNLGLTDEQAVLLMDTHRQGPQPNRNQNHIP